MAQHLLRSDLIGASLCRAVESTDPMRSDNDRRVVHIENAAVDLP